MSDNRYSDKLEKIKEAESLGYINLSDWEMGFLDTIDDLLSAGKTVSWKQSKILNEIFDKIQ